MTDTTESDNETPVVTATEIGAHIVCPRQYEFEYDRPLTLRSTSDDRVRRRRRELLTRSVIAGLSIETTDSEDRVDAALRRFARLRTSSQTPYLLDEQAQYDRRAVEAAIERYLSTDGHDHARNAVAIDATIGYDHDGIRYETTVDVVTKRDSRYLAIKYVPDMDGILQPSWGSDKVERFHDGRGYYPRQIGSLVEAAIAIRSLMNEYGLQPNYDFAYVGLLEADRPAYESTNGIHVDIEQRHFGAAYEAEQQDLNPLIAKRAAAIIAEETDPLEWRFDRITEKTCNHCAYRDACPDYMASELSFVNYQQGGETEEGPPTHPASSGGAHDTEGKR